MNKAFVWFGAIMMVFTIILLAILLKSVGSPGRVTEDSKELGLAAQQQPIQFPAGIGNGQMQLINTPLPVGIGNGQMQLIAQNGPYLGLNLSAVPPDMAPRLGLTAGQGVYVNAVVPTSPGEKAGVTAGDILLRLDGTDLAQPTDVGTILSKKIPGDVLKAVVNRGGATQSVHIVLANVPLGVDVGQLKNSVWLGVDVQDIDAIMRIQFNLPDNNGVLISFVAPGSPAEAVGLRTGDMIRRVGETRIRDVKQFQSILLKGQPDQRLRLSVMRAGAPLDVDVVLGRRPVAPQAVPFLAPADIVVEASWIGMDVAELTKKDITAFNLPLNTKGILAVDVEGAPASTVGFSSGDVLLSVNNIPTPDIKSFMDATRQQAGAVVEILRGNKHVFITVPPPGFTQQGSKLNTGLDRKFRQVGATGPAILAVLTDENAVNARISGEANAQAIVLVDLRQRAYAVVELKNGTPLADLLQQNSATVLLCGTVSGQSAAALRAKGISVYTGLTGNILDGVALYEQQGLVPANGQ